MSAFTRRKTSTLKFLMKIQNAKRWAQTGPTPYLIAMAGYLLAFCIRAAMQPLVGDHLPTMFFGLNGLLIGYFFGFRPAFFILLISIPTAAFSFQAPYFSVHGLSSGDLVKFGGVLSIQTFVLILLESLHRTRYQAELLSRVAATRYQLLVEADEDRRSAVKQLNA